MKCPAKRHKPHKLHLSAAFRHPAKGYHKGAAPTKPHTGQLDPSPLQYSRLVGCFPATKKKKKKKKMATTDSNSMVSVVATNETTADPVSGGGDGGDDDDILIEEADDDKVTTHTAPNVCLACHEPLSSATSDANPPADDLRICPPCRTAPRRRHLSYLCTR